MMLSLVERCQSESQSDKLAVAKQLCQLADPSSEDNLFRTLALATEGETQLLFKKAILAMISHASDPNRLVAQEATKALTLLYQREDLNKFLMPFVDQLIHVILSNTAQKRVLV